MTNIGTRHGAEPQSASQAEGKATSPKRARARRWLLDYPRAIPIAIFVAIIAITALSVFSIESNVKAREAAQMRGDAQSVASALERRGNSFSSYLRAGAALFSSVDEVDQQVFRQFVSELRLDVDYKGVEGIGWVAVVPRTAEAEFLARVRRDQPDFPQIRPKSGASLPRLAIVTYFAPDSARNNNALGFNMYSDPVLASAMDEARRTVRPTASGLVDLASDGGTVPGGSQSGFVILMPVYGGEPLTRDSENSLSGYVYAPFNASRFLEAALETNGPKGLGARLYEGPSASERLLAEIAVDGDPSKQVEQRVTIANREFLLVIESDAPSVLSPLSMATLLFGLAVASLLMLLARLLTQQAHEDQERIAFYEEQNSIRNSLTRELNHRVKNTLANVLSILSLTRRRASDLDEFADSLEGRVRSLSATHDLLTGSDWGTTPIRAVIQAELQHFGDEAESAVSVEGPRVELAPNDALSFGLAIHELATNAAKYGALSVPQGRVTINVRLIEDHLAEIEWREEGGPEVPQNRERGFGTELIEKIIAHELKQPVQLEFAPEGVRCTMRVAVRRHSDFQIREQPKH
ncbi:CHASE domain-containing protein [Erythrobacter sp. THAF29]|uniref:CHASE domain-containing protein n=1 Tax=Erythrobacter sp. THAF29 TaxID=2587851 RepID=UPI001268D724|nr:CHASE domain-containing protein [Erythrobacter sp. THAF29]